MKVNVARICMGILNTIKENSGAVAGGLTMLGIAAMCKKLNLPYQVFTEPFNFNGYSVRAPKLLLVPNNAIEASMFAIYEGVSDNDFDSRKQTAADQIYSVLVTANKNEELSENTKTYAINLLRGIIEKSFWSSTKDHITHLITKIGKGDI